MTGVSAKKIFPAYSSSTYKSLNLYTLANTGHEYFKKKKSLTILEVDRGSKNGLLRKTFAKVVSNEGHSFFMYLLVISISCCIQYTHVGDIQSFSSKYAVNIFHSTLLLVL